MVARRTPLGRAGEGRCHSYTADACTSQQGAARTIRSNAQGAEARLRRTAVCGMGRAMSDGVVAELEAAGLLKIK